MTGTSAEQHLYGRVESRFSPKGSGGYCSFYRSPGLSAADAAQVEGVVKDYSPSADHPRAERLQFFRLTDGRFAFARSVGFDPAHPLYQEYVDAVGRGGGFVAHTLVLPAAAVAAAEVNPFRVFDHLDGDGPFVTTLDALAARVGEYGRKFADCPPLPLPAGWYRHPLMVPMLEVDESAGRVIDLCRAVRQTGQPEVVLRCPPETAADFLRQVFLECRRCEGAYELRAKLTFDTMAKGDKATPFWAVGIPGKPTPALAGRRLLIGMAGGTVQVPAVDGAALTRAEAWLEGARGRLSAERVDDLFPHVCRVAGVLDGRVEYDPADRPAADACRELYAVHPQAVAAEVVRRVSTGLPVALADAVRDELRHLAAEAVAAGQPPWWRADPLPADEQGRWVAACVAAAQPERTKAVRAALRELGERSGEWPLVFWAAEADWHMFGDGGREEALARMTPAQFDTAFALCREGLIGVDKFFHPNHLPAVVRQAAGGRLDEDGLLEVIRWAVDEGRGAELGPLGGRAGDLSADGLLRVAELTTKGADLPEALRPPALVRHLARRPMSGANLLAVVRRLLRAGYAAALEPLADRVAWLSADGLRKLGEWVDGVDGVPDPFRRAVADALRPVLPPLPVLARLHPAPA